MGWLSCDWRNLRNLGTCMRKLLPVLLLLLQLHGYSGYVMAADKFVTAQEKLEKQLARAERWQRWSPMATNSALQEIVGLMKKPELTPETKREAAKRLIKIYYAIDDSLTNSANKKRILEAIGRSDNSEEAQKFFIDILSSDNKEYRRMALWSISPDGTHGDMLYNKIKSMEKAGVLKKGDSLVQLAKADPARGLEEMKEFLKTTQSVKEFVGVALNMPKEAKRNPDVLDIIVGRYPELKSNPKSAMDQGFSPEDAIYFPNLWGYIDARNGARLRTALEMLRMKGVCDIEDIPRLKKKIENSDSIGRESVAEFLGSQVYSGNLPKEKVLSLLREAREKERDVKVKRKMEDIITRHVKGDKK